MKKKTVIAVLSVFAMATAFGAAGCSGKECEHANWLIKPQGGGYHYSECENCGSIKDIESCVDEKNNETQANGADGKCDVCGEEVKKVEPAVYEWKHDDDSHWQEIDGKKENLGGHVDIKDADGKCDTCEAAIKLTVTFDLNGKGQISPAKAEYGKKAEKPDDPAYFGYIFAGWYSDYELNDEFDFTQPITASTTVYAKWDEDETPGTGYNPGHAVVSSLATESFKTFGEAQKLYFKLTVEESGRYQVDLRGAASEKCAYVTDIDNDKYTVTDNGVTYFDLDEGDSVVVEVTRGEAVADDEVCAPYFLTVSNEKLGGAWKKGVYAAGAHEIVLNENNLVYTVEDTEAPVSFSYIGGRTNTLSFSYGQKEYTATLNKSGDIVLKNDGKSAGVFKFYDTENAVELAEFEGAYELIAERSCDLLEFAFDGADTISTRQIIRSNGKDTGDFEKVYKVGAGTTFFYEKSGALVIDNHFIATLVKDAGGEIIGLSVTESLGGEEHIYTRNGHMIPVSIPVGKGESFAGHLYQFVYSEGQSKVYWSPDFDDEVEVTAYDFDTKTYTVAYGATEFKLNAEVDGDGVKTFYLYDAEGKAVDTLSPSRKDDLTHSLPAGGGTLDIDVNDFLLNNYYLYAQEEGWYVFSSDTPLTAYVNIYKHGDTLIGIGTKVSINGSAIKLSADSYIKFSIVGEHPETVKITVGKDTDGSLAPAGTSVNNPVELSGTGKFPYTVGYEDYMYYKYTASKPGTYIITINGPEYYINDSETKSETSSSVELTEGNLTFTVKVSLKWHSGSELRIEEDCTKGAKLTPDAEGKGVITSSGAYYLDGFGELPFATGLKISVKTEEPAEEGKFRIYIDGDESEVSSYEFRGAYVSDKLAHGFAVVLADGQQLEWAIAFNEGAKENPVVLEKAGSSSASLSKAGEVKYFRITAPENKNGEDYKYVISVTGKDGGRYGFEADGNDYAEDGLYSLTAGDSAVIAVKYLGAAGDFDKDGEFDVNLFYDFSDGAVEMKFDDFASGDKTKDGTVAAYKAIEVEAGVTLYRVDSTYGGSIIISGYSEFGVVNGDAAESATKGAGGVFTATIPAGENLYFRLSSAKNQLLTFVVSCAAGTVFNPYEVKLKADGSSEKIDIGAGEEMYFALPSGGTYFCENAKLDLNGKILNKGEAFAFNGGDKLKIKAEGRVTLAFSYAALPEFRGVYEAEGVKFTVNAAGLIYAGEKYALASVSGDAYKFGVYKTGEVEGETEIIEEKSVTLTLNGAEGGKYGDKELSFSPMFIADAAQTYTGVLNYAYTDNYNLTLNLTQNGIATLSGDNGVSATALQFGEARIEFVADPVNVTDNGDGTYSFPYYTVIVKSNGNANNGLKNGTATFGFDAGGKLNFAYSNNNAYKHTMNPSKAFDPYGEEEGEGIFSDYPAVVQSYSGTVTMVSGFLKYDFVLILKKSGKVLLTTEAPVTVKGDVTDNGDGTYSFPICRGSDNNGTATFSFGAGGVITLNMSSAGSFDDGAKLTPETEFDPEALGLGGEQAPSLGGGTYTGKVGSDNITLTVNDDLTATHVGDNGTFSVTISESDGKYTYETYVNQWFHPIYTITVNADGSLSVTESANNTSGTLVPAGEKTPELQAGVYTCVSGDNRIRLVVNADMTGTYFESQQSDDALNITIASEDGRYSFAANFSQWVAPTCSITVNADGTLTISQQYSWGAGGTYTLSPGELPEEPGVPEQPSQLTAGTYKGTGEETGIEYELVIDEGGGTGVYKMFDPDGGFEENIEFTFSGGVWSFDYLGEVKMTVNEDGSITVHDMEEVTVSLS